MQSDQDQLTIDNLSRTLSTETNESSSNKSQKPKLSLKSTSYVLPPNQKNTAILNSSAHIFVPSSSGVAFFTEEAKENINTANGQEKKKNKQKKKKNKKKGGSETQNAWSQPLKKIIKGSQNSQIENEQMKGFGKLVFPPKIKPVVQVPKPPKLKLVKISEIINQFKKSKHLEGNKPSFEEMRRKKART